MVNTNHYPNWIKQVCESLFIPKLPRKSRIPNPLVNSLNGSRIGIEKRDLETRKKSKPFNKTRSVEPHIFSVRNSGEFKEDPTITQLDILHHPFNMFAIQLSFGNN